MKCSGQEGCTLRAASMQRELMCVVGTGFTQTLFFSVKTAFRNDRPFSLYEADQRYGQTLNMSAKTYNCLRNGFWRF